MKTLVYWILAVALLVGGFLGGRFIHSHTEESAAAEPAATKPTAEPMHLLLTPEQIQAGGIKAEEIQSGTQTPEVALFGSLQEDPNESFTLRAPISGATQAAPGRAWPLVGERLADNTPVGAVMPRIMPADQFSLAAQRVALESQLATAQSDSNAATVALDAARATYERNRKLNEQDKNVSDRVVEESQAAVKTEEARVEGAKRATAVAQAAISSLEFKLMAVPMTVVRGGEVVEVSVQPQESVESGQTILRVTRLDHLLAAIDVPLGTKLPKEVDNARIVPLNRDENPLDGTAAREAPAADPKTRNNILLFHVALPAADRMLRPGDPVTAYVALGGETLKGVLVPRSAVVHYQGKAWVYVYGEEKQKLRDFERREVPQDQPTPSGQEWFVIQGFKADEKLVTTGAALLLSMETNTFGG